MERYREMIKFFTGEFIHYCHKIINYEKELVNIIADFFYKYF